LFRVYAVTDAYTVAYPCLYALRNSSKLSILLSKYISRYHL